MAIKVKIQIGGGLDALHSPRGEYTGAETGEKDLGTEESLALSLVYSVYCKEVVE